MLVFEMDRLFKQLHRLLITFHYFLFCYNRDGISFPETVHGVIYLLFQPNTHMQPSNVCDFLVRRYIQH